jgi:drug/metabolite transporter (DMT)-like permease
LNPGIDQILVVFVLNSLLIVYYIGILAKVGYYDTLYGKISRGEVLPVAVKVITGGMTSMIYLASLSCIPLSIATMIFNLSPVVTVIISLTCIREDISKLDIFNIIFAFIGFFFIVAGQFTEDSSTTGLDSSNQVAYYSLFFALCACPFLQASGNHAMRKCQYLPLYTVYAYDNLFREIVCVVYFAFFLEDKSQGYPYLATIPLTSFLIMFAGSLANLGI